MNISKEYLINLLNKGVRLDGRKFDEYRKIKIEIGVSKHAEGSARVKIGETDVIAGVKLEIGEPYSDTPDDGAIIVGVELLALSNPEFESGPPNLQSIELARVVDRGIREAKVIDLKKLCIEKGKNVWLVLIDIYTINDDGNLQDAAFLASMLALMNTKIPNYDGEKIDYTKRKEKLPLLKTVTESTIVKIGKHILVDPCLEEEKLIDARLTIATNKDRIYALQKGGNNTISIQELEQMLVLGERKGEELGGLLK